jgi:DNA-binding beta-propeller fold protein YncE
MMRWRHFPVNKQVFYLVFLLSTLGCLTGCSRDQTPVISTQSQEVTIGRGATALGLFTPSHQLIVSNREDASLTLVDEKTLAVQQTMSVPAWPGILVVDSEISRIYCLHLRDRALSIIGGTPLHVIRTLGIGEIGLSGGMLRPGHRELWTSDGTLAVHVLNPDSMNYQKRILLGRYPQNIAFTTDGRFAYVTLKGENAVAVIACSEFQEIKRIPVGIYPRGIIAVKQWMVVSNFGSHDVSILDTRTHEQVKRLVVRRQPNSLAYLQGTVWISCEDSYRLVGLDVEKQQLIGTIKTGFYPGALLSLPDQCLAVLNPRQQKLVVYSFPSDK